MTMMSRACGGGWAGVRGVQRESVTRVRVAGGRRSHGADTYDSLVCHAHAYTHAARRPTHHLDAILDEVHLGSAHLVPRNGHLLPRGTCAYVRANGAAPTFE